MSLNVCKIGLTFAGCFLGAGFLSGQEIYQFFGSYGIWGLLGIFISIILLFIFGIVLMQLANKTGYDSSGKMIIMWENSFLRSFVSVAEIFFLTGIAVIMVAGAGSLFYQVFGISKYISSFIFCLMLFFLINGGHKRMISFFSIIVPVLVILTFIISIYAIFKYRISLAYDDIYIYSKTNKLLGNWWFSALAFVSYNLFSSVEILAPIGKIISSKKLVFFGIAFGSILLMLTATSIFIAITSCPLSFNSDLPMLYLANSLSSVLGLVYAILIFLGMMGTALSSSVAVVHFCLNKSNRKYRYLFSAVLCVFSYFASLFGFGNLIGTLYPICGYFGIIAIVLIIIHFVKVR